MRLRSLLLASLSLTLLAACSRSAKKPDEAAAVAAAPAPTPAAAVAAPAAAPAAAPKDTAKAPARPAGFDLGAAPVAAAPKLGAWPYFTLLDGFRAGKKSDSGVSSEEGDNQLKNVAFDRYEFFDGVKIIPVEGKLTTIKALGKGASFFQVQKTYQKLVQDLGGVTVWEGNMQQFQDAKLKFDEPRHRGRYTMWSSEKAGTYVLRAPDKEVWVEVYQKYADSPDNYWLTVVERKALPMTAGVLPAAALKKALDEKGRVAVYLNFDTNQATLKPDAQAGVAQIIALLAQNPDLKLRVEGHTDNQGTPAANQTLSEARARTVVATLTAQGVAADRLAAAGFGQTKPLADNATDAGRAQNRRVELVRQ